MSQAQTLEHASDRESRLRSHRLGLARRLRNHLVNKTSDLGDAPLRIDPDIYVNQARFEAERLKVFRETPVVACLSTDVKSPGDFFTFDDTGVPIIVVRSKDGQVRAFLNVCPHRGARLVRPESGRAARFTCWFHGWTFTNEGKLLAAPEAAKFGEELADCNHLTALPAEEREGFVFVIATPGMTMDLDAHLGEFAEQLDNLGIQGFVPVKSTLMTAKSNWKYILDTFYENYHLPSMHSKTLAPNYRGDINLYDIYGPHFRFVQVERSMEQWLVGDEAGWQLDHQLVGSSYLFPNTYITAAAKPALSDSPGGCFYAVFRIFPGQSVGETNVYMTLYGAANETGEEYMAQIEANCAAMVYLLTTEDFTMAEEAWLGLSAVPKGQMFIVGPQERLVQELELSIAERAGMPLRNSSSWPSTVAA